MKPTELESGIKNRYYERLNQRFDERVAELTELGYKYFKDYAAFALNWVDVKNNRGILNAVIMHCDDYHWTNILQKQ